MEVLLAAATVLLWTTLLLMHEQLPAATSRLIGLGTLVCLAATFVVSDRRHTAMRSGASLGRVAMLIGVFAVIGYVAYFVFLGWGMRDWVF